MHDLIRANARTVLGWLERGEVSHMEVLDALEARVGALDGAINALPTLCFERARQHAQAIAARPAGQRGVLGGLPVPIKDLCDVAGVRSTNASPIYAEHVPTASAWTVERIEARGGVVYAKSNTPEFGAGASTFNEVFGRTANPWGLSRSCAGSSGGAAAALASGMAWLAQGSDMGGSLRTPASFCGVVGLRPAPGRVPAGPGADAFGTLSVEGPMARNVGDLGLLLDAMAGPDPRDARSLPELPHFRASAEAPRLPRRVAFSPDLAITPVEPEVAALCERAARRFEALGVPVEEACPDFSGALECFQTLRGLAFATSHARHYAEHRALLKPDIVWNVERGLAVTGEEVARAHLVRSRIVAETARFFETYDLLLCPTAIVTPFPVETRTVTECAGTPFETYIDWLAIVAAITLSAAPALSLPCGFTGEGLPVGLQMVGRLRGEAALLSHAAVLEAELGLDTGPIEPRP